MESQMKYGSTLFRSIDDDLNASLATADELSREFSSLMEECSTSRQVPETQAKPLSSGGTSQNVPAASFPTSPNNGGSGRYVSAPSTTAAQVPEPSHRPLESVAPAATTQAGVPSRLTAYNGSQKAQRSPSPRPHVSSVFSQSPRVAHLPSPTVHSAFESGQRSPRTSTLPRNFLPFKQSDDGAQRPKIPTKWNETDLDASYDKKPHHTYDKTEWLRPAVPNSNWRESNLDAPPPSSRKDPQSRSGQYGYLPHNVRLTLAPDRPSSPHGSPSYGPQPIVSRISIPPASPRVQQRRPIPLSVIMRLQNPQYFVAPQPPSRGPEQGSAPYRQPTFVPSDYLPQPPPPELRQPGFYGEVLVPEDVEAELRGWSQGGITRSQRTARPPALKRRGSVDQSRPAAKGQYKQVISKLFRRKEIRRKGEPASESSSSSDGEDPAASPSAASTPSTPTPATPQHKGVNSILRKSKEQRGSGRRAHLSPLVLLLDGALVGELETVQRAVQEMSDPSQANDEGITAIHNAICGGHYAVVEFLVRIGANVSAPDSHGWTPLHCAASCNDQMLCEYLVRNGAAVMAVTESDGATAAQKCDPYAVGFQECEGFLRGVEDAMGVENSGVLYALWGYPAQAPDELSFREGDMVTILQKPEGSDWWWASLCGREGFVPNNFFGLFPKVRPKSLC
ncbi:hypothetical protein ANANG_G00240910 [Anguilla anguilla]|uniref:SH3 domain-containing protein n=1 Tax=Anguilla anguilla TaxID=7936 RepID=A0A9D3LV77_ANGAN|nr:hypothetical protein ANANG_G00240910 [Anguilla anguilla]